MGGTDKGQTKNVCHASALAYSQVRHTCNATGEMNLLFCVTVIKQKLQKYAKTWMYFNFPVLTWVSSVFLCVILLNMSFFVVLSPVK